MLQYGLDDLLSQHGVTFTVSGVEGSFSCIAENPIAGNILSEAGMREDASLSITFATDVGYTPTVGDVVTAKGQTWAVTSVETANASYVLTLTGRSQ